VAKAIKCDPDMLEPGEKEAIETGLSALKDAMAGNDRQRITAGAHHLDEVTAPFAQRRIERDLQLAISGKAAADVAKALGI
jgi:molecular chaperone HscA